MAIHKDQLLSLILVLVYLYLVISGCFMDSPLALFAAKVLSWMFFFGQLFVFLLIWRSQYTLKMRLAVHRSGANNQLLAAANRNRKSKLAVFEMLICVVFFIDGQFIYTALSVGRLLMDAYTISIIKKIDWQSPIINLNQ